MKRRSFLKYTSLTTAGMSFALNGYGINPTPRLPFLSALAANGNPQGRVLVLVQLTGGNDGLNTFVPLDQYDKLMKLRSNIMLPQNGLLTLSGNATNAFHPAMADMRKLYDDGYLKVVQNVGYPNQDYSHFRSTDIWMSGSDADEIEETGWLGRYLQDEHPDFPAGYPNADFPDPLAIQIGSVISLALMGNQVPMGMAINDATAYYQFVNDVVAPVPNSPYGQELEYVRLVAQQAQLYYESVKGAAAVGQNLSSKYPPAGQNPLADQLKIIAQLISGGLQTPVYLVSLDGFDTHSEQVDLAGGTTTGAHADLLHWLSEAVGAFQDDLNKLGVADRVAGMTFSEFGRTIASNFSLGTDHGAAAPLFVFGKNIIPGILGNNPNIPNNPNISADIPMQYDFRSVYASALQDWFGLENPESVLEEEYPILPIFKAPVSGTHSAPRPGLVEASNSPNPMFGYTTITFTTETAGHVTIRLVDAGGKVVRMLHEGHYPAGSYQVQVDRQDLQSGMYVYQIQLNKSTVSRKLLVF